MANNHASSLFLFSLRYKSDVMPYIFMIVSNNVDSDKLICTLYTFDGFHIKLSNLIVYSRLRSMWDITALTIGPSLKLVLATNHTSRFSTSLIAPVSLPISLYTPTIRSRIPSTSGVRPGVSISISSDPPLGVIFHFPFF